MDGWVRELLDGLKDGLLRLYGERLDGVYLYGSYARGEANAESDLDLLVVLREVPDYSDEIERTSELIASMALHYDVSVSRVFVSRTDWERAGGPFLSTVRQDAVAA
jgi:predicted nucleotidyltransferase